MVTPRTMFDKIWDAHVVRGECEQPALIYVDLLLLHEVNSPQSFEGLRLAGRRVRRPERAIAAMDHVVPTRDRHLPIADEMAVRQLEALARNCAQFGLTLYDLDSPRQGILHVIGPELGVVRPGMAIVCSDSHASTHGAFGALALGCGASDIEHVLATQCLSQRRPKTMEIRLKGTIPDGVSAKDLILHVIGVIGVSGATGHVIEYTGEAVRSLSMDGRMTLCNMSIEAGARAGSVAPDETTLAYLEGCPFASTGREWEQALGEWRMLPSDPGATYDRALEIDVSGLSPCVTWGTNPGMVAPVTGQVPDPASFAAPSDRHAAERALTYMGLQPGTHIQDIPIDRVFIGSCTNGRLEDLRVAARVVRGKRVDRRVRAMVVPGSRAVKRQAEMEGLDRIFTDAGFEWREPGCSLCQAMNADTLASGERCASTSNRNFENRQGKNARTHLVSPATAAASAIAGHFADVRDWPREE